MFFVVISIFFLVFISNISKIVFCHKWMLDEEKKMKKDKINSDIPLFLIIPVLNEQRIIKETYYHFRNLVIDFDNVYTIFVTTEKEKNSGKKTFDIIVDLLNVDVQQKMFVINYPHKSGVMAHQLNYAIEKLREQMGTNDFWIGVYNADSRINTDTINYVLKRTNNTKCDKFCMQQYSWYYCNKEKQKGVMPSCALWQTRWSITFEMARVLIQNYFSRLPLPKFLRIHLEKMNYIIGHGFFINAKTLHLLGGFPQNTINEDACLGYLINCNDIKIYPIPVLEMAESPDKINVYLNQQDTWYNGPVYAFEYYRLYKKKENCDKYRCFLFAFKLFLHAIYWIAAPLILYFACMFMIDSVEKIIIWLIIIFLHMPFTNFIVHCFAKKHKKHMDFSVPRASVACIPFYFIHCLGPLKNIWKQLKGRNTIDNKYKTER